MCKPYKKFPDVNPKQSFPKMEEEILSFWRENDIFKQSIENRKDSEEFNFYDGPPFATGTPHYGHILAGTIKDVIPRYQTMKGFRVDRRFGWDCHGLPIENIVEKKMEISGKDDIEKRVGVHTFNEECRANVFGYVDEWKKTVERMGRWVDMENDYKTMDTSFMESVWWVYKSLYEKGLIYEGHRVVPYCPRCSTPLSNFEVNQGYKDKQDKTVTVKFKVKETESKYILAWTTTPWTLVANLGLAVGPDLDYVEVKVFSGKWDENLRCKYETHILAKKIFNDSLDDKGNYKNLYNGPLYDIPSQNHEIPLIPTIVREYKGACLVGINYEPVFDDFWTLNEAKDMPLGMELGENAFKVIKGHHVTTESGTGIVHIAPAYGEDDNIIGREEKLGFVSHIADNGNTENLLEDNAVPVFEYNELAINKLKEKNQTVLINTYDHSYPHCWRCDTPLIYRAISAWYVAVEKIKEEMVKNNKNINWVPEEIKNGRMGKWLEGAKDWNISRNRYWGSAIPVWQNKDKSEEVCIGSIDELYQKNKEFGQITKVIFVRHGRTDYNEKGLMDYKNEAKLNEDGKKQANQLKEIFKNEKIDAIFSSPLDRCKDTISPLSQDKNLEINEIEDFIEVNSPELQGKEFSCKNYDWENGYGGGETIKEVYSRVEKAFHKIIEENKGKTIVICSHGDPSFLARMSLHKDIDYTKKYTSGLYLENNPEKYTIDSMYGVEYVYTEEKIAIDLHKHYVDKIYVKGGKTEKLTRIPEVLDCWFESGAMPYASKGYPFEGNSHPELDSGSKKEDSSFKFPADFIAEGLDQTRGWFYTLIILGTALFDKAPMKNVIVNGIVLAEDGHKMSKSKKNYPDPQIIFDNYGADAMRFYLMNSPVVEAQDLRFMESGVEEVVKKVILPLWNTYSFFTTYANIDNFNSKGLDIYKLENNLDKWLISELNELTKEVSTGFDEYKLNNAAKPIVKFMDNLTNWYIRRSRKRFWKTENDGDKLQAYETLYYTLVQVSKIIAPFMPFVSEYIYKNLTDGKSVHLEDFPVYDENLIDKELNSDTDLVQKIITLGLAFRANNKIRVRQPLASITITTKLDSYYEEIIKEELNVKEVIVVEGDKLAKKICKPNGRTIGPKFGKDVKFIITEAKNGNFIELEDSRVKVGDFILDEGDFEIEYQAPEGETKIEAGFGMVISMDTQITEELKNEGYIRDIVRHIQESRKEADYKVDDRIKVSISGADTVIENFVSYIENETLSNVENEISNPDIEKNLEIDDFKIILKLKK